MWRRAWVGVTVVLLALLAISGRSRFDGPVVLQLSTHHGLHAADLLVMALAAGGLWALASSSSVTRGR